MPFKPDPDSILSVEAQFQIFLEMTAKLRVSYWDQDNLEEYAVEGVLAELKGMDQESLDEFIAETLSM